LWWRALTGSDDTLHNAYLMRMAGRFSRRRRAYAKAHGIPVVDVCLTNSEWLPEYRKYFFAGGP